MKLPEQKTGILQDFSLSSYLKIYVGTYHIGRYLSIIYIHIGRYSNLLFSEMMFYVERSGKRVIGASLNKINFRWSSG